MKKTIKIFICTFILLLLTSCSTISTLVCRHNFIEEKVINATCTSEGKTISICTKCKKEQQTSIPKLRHVFGKEIVIDATCTEDGIVYKECNLCNEKQTISKEQATGHLFDSWQTKVIATQVNDGIEERICKKCHKKETKIIKSVTYIDLDIINAKIDFSELLQINNKEDLIIVHNCALLNQVQSFSADLNFDFGDFDTLFDEMSNSVKVETTSSARIGLSGNRLTVTYTYPEVEYPITSTTKKGYPQYSSANYNQVLQQRDDNFNNFKIEDSITGYSVKTSDQLVYALERRVKPLVVEGSQAEKMYNMAKAILRKIITDDMSDFEKIKAIHDYIVMNVEYDNALLEKVYENEKDLKKYNGFYLEGVFQDKKAVCEGISKAICVLLNIEGIPCVRVSGYKATNPNGVGHAWNKVYLNGDWYILDATSDNSIISSTFELLSYEYFLISDEEMNKTYIAKDFKNIECKKIYDSFEEMKFTIKNHGLISFATYSYKIKSKQQLEALITYLHQNKTANITVQFEIAYTPHKSINDDIQAILAKQLMDTSFSYIPKTSNNIFTLILKDE